MKNIVFGVVTVIVIAANVAFFMATHHKPKPITPQPSAVATAIILYTTDGFSPTELTIEQNTLVTITNNSPNPVKPTSDPYSGPSNNPELNYGLIKPGESKGVIIRLAGAWGMHNQLDQAKIITIMVK